MRLRKAEVSVTVLVLVVVMLLSAFVIGKVALKQVGLLKKSDDRVCSVSLFLNSMTKIAGKPIVSPECEHRNIQITGEDLERAKQTNGDTYNALYKNKNDLGKISPQTSTITQYTKYYDDLSEGDNSDLPEWYVQQVIAKELTSCWDKVGMGEYNLFDDLEASLMDCSEIEDSKRIGDCKDGEGFVGTIFQAAKNIKDSAGNAYKVPSFCLLCARIKFENLNKTGEYNYNSLNINDPWLWLYNNQVPKDKVSYFDYLSKNTFQGNDGRTVYGGFAVTDNQAVIYVKERRFLVTKKFFDILNSGASIFTDRPFFDAEYKDEKGNPVDFKQYTAIVDYDTLPDTCTYLIG